MAAILISPVAKASVERLSQPFPSSASTKLIRTTSNYRLQPGYQLLKLLQRFPSKIRIASRWLMQDLLQGTNQLDLTLYLAFDLAFGSRSVGSPLSVSDRFFACVVHLLVHIQNSVEQANENDVARNGSKADCISQPVAIARDVVARPSRTRSELPTFRFKNVLDYMFFVLVLSPKDGARARNRSICEFDYEHEHHFIEHEHEFKLKDVGNSER